MMHPTAIRVRVRSEGGFFNAQMDFPQDYPNMPPKLKILSSFYHPNVYDDGTVCTPMSQDRPTDRTLKSGRD